MRVLPTDVELVELVKRAFGYKTDVELAGFLGVRKETISAIKNNRAVIGEGLRYTILDKLHVLDRVAYRAAENMLLGRRPGEEPRAKPEAATALGEKCAPRRLINKILELRGSQHERWALPELSDGPAPAEDASLLDLYISFKSFKTDAEAADALGIKRNSISMVRHGKSRLGPLPRLRIYRDVYGEDTSQLEEALESSASLLKIVQQYVPPSNSTRHTSEGSNEL